MATNSYDFPGSSAYRKYEVNNVHRIISGVLVLPVASESSQSVQVRMHGGQGVRRIKFDIAKEGNPPVVPLPSDTVGDDALISADVNILTPTPNDQLGSYNWIVRGEYEYMTVGAAREMGADQLPLTSYPYLNIRQDMIAGASLSGKTPAQLESELIQTNALTVGGWLWPLTVFPSNLCMNPNLIGE